MYIKNIQVENFKVFKDTDLNLKKYNIVIGANASGKSSLVEIFKFLYNIANEGLANAVSMAGGIEYLRNINLGSSVPLRFSVTVGGFSGPRRQEFAAGNVFYRQVREIKYSFKLDFSTSAEDYSITDDRLEIEMTLQKNIAGDNDNKNNLVSITLSRENGNPVLNIDKENDFSEEFLTRDMILPSFFSGYEIGPRQSLLETPIAFVIEPSLKDIIRGISVYNINPALAREVVSAHGKIELEEDGSNLPLVLNQILSVPSKKEKFLNILNDILPFIESVNIEEYAGRSLLLHLKEKYTRDKFVPASLFSDGTVCIAALIVALYFEKGCIALIEEPERNIHPSLISRIVEMIKEVSTRRQIIVTTHNPELLKYTDIKNLFLVHRGEKGFAHIMRPAEKKEVSAFLNRDMGIDELYIQNLLEV